MPIPKPKKGEKEKDYIDRCMSALKDSEPNKPQKQRLAMCYRTWRKAKGQKEPDAQVDTVIYWGGFEVYRETFKAEDLINSLKDQNDDSYFALVRGEEKFFQYKENGVINPRLLLDSLKTVDDVAELTDEERKEAKILLISVAEKYVKASREK